MKTRATLWNFFRRQLPRRPSYAVGSGFIVDKAGYILTNYHVVEDASRITVRLQSGEEYVAKIIGADDQTDLAVLKIEAGHDLPFVNLGNSDASQVGDWVLAIGSPFGLAQTVQQELSRKPSAKRLTLRSFKNLFKPTRR